MTDQEIIDDIYAKLQAQGGPGYDYSREGCKYLTPSGNKCAVGLYIPDGHPAQKDNGSPITLFRGYPDLLDAPILRERSPCWWREAQRCHDMAAIASRDRDTDFFEGFRSRINASPAIDAQL